jgi:hypothetical protein
MLLCWPPGAKGSCVPSAKTRPRGKKVRPLTRETVPRSLARARPFWIWIAGHPPDREPHEQLEARGRRRRIAAEPEHQPPRRRGAEQHRLSRPEIELLLQAGAPQLQDEHPELRDRSSAVLGATRLGEEYVVREYSRRARRHPPVVAASRRKINPRRAADCRADQRPNETAAEKPQHPARQCLVGSSVVRF